MEKSSQIICAISVSFHKNIQSNEPPNGENSPNLVTLPTNKVCFAIEMFDRVQDINYDYFINN
jgi:hypothetical protein